MKNKLENINRFLINESVRVFSQKINYGESVLDAGGGGGHYRSLFTKATYIVIDMGLEQPDTAGLDIIGDICLLPFRTASFDHVMCVEVLEHVWDSDKLLQELNRVVKDGGNLLLTVPLCLGEHMQPYDFYRYTRFGLSKLLHANGFEVLSIQPRGGYFTLFSYLLAKIPDQILQAKNLSAFSRKALKIVFRVLFTYMLSPIFLRLDCLDDAKNFTLGYICEAKKNFKLPAAESS